MTQFVHLRVHTEYSLLDSVARIPELIAATARAGMPAIALTDESNLFAMVKFYRAAQSRGVKPIIGVDLRLRDGVERQEPARLTLLSQNLAGYRNLTRLMTRAYLEGQRRGVPLIDRSWLTAASTSGLIALSGAQEGDVGRALLNNRPDEARRFLEQWRELFGNRFYVEIQRLGRTDEEDYLDAVLNLVATCPTAIVATNDVRFITRQDFESHEARVCIQEGSQLADPARRRRYS
ncbi:MAG TPA: PHP domain-containing protein, partial [Steroidobacteraceae bacterium]